MITQYLKGGYPILWVQTHEEDRAISAMGVEAVELGYECLSWDIAMGDGDPMSPLIGIESMEIHSIMFLKDYHKFIGGTEIFRTIKNLRDTLKTKKKHLIIVSPVVNIPIELEKDITLIDFPLPTQEELVGMAKDIIGKVNKDNNLSIKIDKEAMAAACGLTAFEAENALARSLVSTKKIDMSILEEEKLQGIKKSGLMEIGTAVKESELGGLDGLKKYLHNRKKGFWDTNLPTPRGILLVGLPGAGKSLSSKVTASVLGFPLVNLNIASLKGSRVGESEKNMSQALSLIDAISPCVVMCDEIEKNVGGAISSNKTDGGTGSAMFGTLLTWMQESVKPKYVVATCNDVEDLLAVSQGALLRRFDDIFFLDLPNDKERKQILKIMNKRYGTKHKLPLTKKMMNWTGAEIEKFVVASIYDGEESALENIKPIYIQNKDNIEKTRGWAKNNARYATIQDNPKKAKERRLSL